MLQRSRRFLALLSLLAVASPVSGEPPAVLVCFGHEPEWSLRIDGAEATLAMVGATGLRETRFEGRLQEAAGTPQSFVYRGGTGSSEDDLVAVVTSEACVDTGADPPGERPYTAHVSLPDGALRVGCCSISPAAAPSPEGALAPRSAVGVPAPASLPPRGAALPTATGKITALTLPDGQMCRRTSEGGSSEFGGLHVDFDCGPSLGTRVGLAGPLTAGPEGLVALRKLTAEWRDGEAAPRAAETAGETTAARVSEIVLADGLMCRSTGAGATLIFEGRRAAYNCGTRGGETVALLGDLEPVEGGFRIMRARVAHEEKGFRLVSSETVLVTPPR